MPDPTPALWLVGSDLADDIDGQPVIVWPDRSIYQRDVSNWNTATCPTFDTSVFPDGAVAFSPPSVLDVTSPFAVTNDWALFVVAYPGMPGIVRGFGVLGSSLPASRACFGWKPGEVFVGELAGGESFPISPDPINAPHLFVTRLVSGQCHLRVDGVEIGSGVLAANNNFPIGPLTLVQASHPGTNVLIIAELQLYDQAISDDLFAAVEAALLAEYGISP